MTRVPDALKVALLLLASAGIVGGAAWLTIANQEPERNLASLCAPALERGHTMILVDKTDLWNDAQADRLEDHIWWFIAKKMQTEEKLSIFTFSDELKPGFPPLFSFCKPPSGEEADDITKSKSYYNRQYKKQFIEPLKAILDNVKKAEEKECSPIIEVLFDILTRRETYDHRGLTRIVLISDMAQNSPLYSFFLTTKCLGRPVVGDHRKDTTRVEAYIREREPAINKRELSVMVFQVVPAKNPPNIAQGVKYTWGHFFRFFGVPAEWQLL